MVPADRWSLVNTTLTPPDHCASHVQTLWASLQHSGPISIHNKNTLRPSFPSELAHLEINNLLTDLKLTVPGFSLL